VKSSRAAAESGVGLLVVGVFLDNLTGFIGAGRFELLGFDPRNQPLAAPKLYVVAVNSLLCPNRGARVGIANEGPETDDMVVIAQDTGYILCHRSELLFPTMTA
jgi:hypothetical protein